MAGMYKVLNHDEAVRVDTASATITYIGKAKIGTATSAPNWKISQLNSASGVVITYADSGNYSQIWDNRSGLVYA